jgi:kumamolisin
MNHNISRQKKEDRRARSLFVTALMFGCAFGIVTQAAPQTITAPTTPAIAQHASTRGKVISPQSNIENPGDIGFRAHTNIELMIPSGRGSTTSTAPGFGAVTLASTTPAPGFVAETPASLGCVYFLVSTRVSGCNPTTATLNPSGGSKAIAIVDAFDDSNAATDLATFSAQFGLPAANFSKVFASGVKPPQDPTGGWELEASLDIEWAHAMAPSAKIILVEAASNSLSNLLAAETVAANLVAAAGGGEVSNSWGGGEFSGETSLDSKFIKSGVVFFASTGDRPGTEWPGVSPNVVAAGGTTISRNPSSLGFIAERPWAETGGGRSRFETIPSYQTSLATIVGSSRGVPDVSFDGDPNTGVWVFDSTPVGGSTSGCCGVRGWWIVGGTSVSAPALAGVVNSAGHFATSSDSELTTIYSNLGNTADFHDIAIDYCGPFAGLSGKTGWDFCTGVGSIQGKAGK